jgi:hypothetical protein
MKMRFHTVRCLLGLSLLLAVGCGGSGGKGTVSGTVSYRGQPLPTGNIAFFDSKGQPLTAATIHDGKYTVNDLPPGPVKITISTPPEATPPKGQQAESPAQAIRHIPYQYSIPDQSTLTYEVKPGSQEHPIELN